MDILGIVRDFTYTHWSYVRWIFKNFLSQSVELHRNVDSKCLILYFTVSDVLYKKCEFNTFVRLYLDCRILTK